MHLTQVRVQSFLAFLIQPFSTWFRAYQGPENAPSISGSNLSCRNHRTSRAPVSLSLETTLVVYFRWKITNNGFLFNLVTAGYCYVFSCANMDHFRFFFMVALITVFKREKTAEISRRWFPCEMHLRNERRNSILMTRHYPDLGSGSDWSSRVGNLLQPIRSITQTWVVKGRQYGISVAVSETWFRRGTRSGVAKCQLFSQANSL